MTRTRPTAADILANAAALTDARPDVAGIGVTVLADLAIGGA